MHSLRNRLYLLFNKLKKLNPIKHSPLYHIRSISNYQYHQNFAICKRNFFIAAINISRSRTISVWKSFNELKQLRLTWLFILFFLYFSLHCIALCILIIKLNLILLKRIFGTYRVTADIYLHFKYSDTIILKTLFDVHYKL